MLILCIYTHCNILLTVNLCNSDWFDQMMRQSWCFFALRVCVKAELFSHSANLSESNKCSNVQHTTSGRVICCFSCSRTKDAVILTTKTHCSVKWFILKTVPWSLKCMYWTINQTLVCSTISTKESRLSSCSSHLSVLAAWTADTCCSCTKTAVFASGSVCSCVTECVSECVCASVKTVCVSADEWGSASVCLMEYVFDCVRVCVLECVWLCCSSSSSR